MEDILIKKINELAATIGLELIDCRIFQSSGNTAIRCAVDFPAGGVTIDICVKLNHLIDDYLRISGLINQEYSVEVNSPGLDRLLKTYKDFYRNIGKTVCLWLSEPVNAKTYWQGRIIRVTEITVSIETEKAVLDIPCKIIKTGKLLLEIK